jgi:DNA-binding MarR family transcriptional regulator
MASKAEIIDKYGVVQHMLNIARHNRKEQAAKADANVDRVLAMLRLKDNVALKDLETVLGVDSEALATTLGAMSADGLVQLVEGEDGTAESVSITEQGAEDQPKVQPLEDMALAGFSDDELEIFESYLNRMDTAITAEIGADWKEREEERRAASKKRDDRKPFDRDGGSRGGFGGDRGGRGSYGDRGGRGGDRGGYRGGRDDRGGSRGGYGDRGGSRGGYGRDDRGSRGGYGDRGGSRGGFGGDRGGYRGGRDDRGGSRGGYGDRGGRGSYGDRGGYRGGRDDRGGDRGSRGSYGDRR